MWFVRLRGRVALLPTRAAGPIAYPDGTPGSDPMWQS